MHREIEATAEHGMCYLWGDRGGKRGRKYWDAIETGDLALCYSNWQIIGRLIRGREVRESRTGRQE
jgi:hypothetical protein